MDIQRRSSLARLIQQQKLCRFIGLLEVGNVGHHRGARLLECLRRNANRDGHHVLHYYPPEDSVLHRQFDSADRSDFVPLRVGLLLAS